MVNWYNFFYDVSISESDIYSRTYCNIKDVKCVCYSLDCKGLLWW